MNERIRELAEQADSYAKAEYEKWTPTADFSGVPHIRNIFNKKFAELIVQECAKTAAMFSMENKRIHPDIDPCDMPKANQMVYHSTCQSVAYAIKEHFGVEE